MQENFMLTKGSGYSYLLYRHGQNDTCAAKSKVTRCTTDGATAFT